MVKEFKTFILRGNVIDLAVGIVIGAAFNTVVQSLIKDIFTPAIGLLFSVRFVGLSYHRGHVAYILFGDFLNALISFLVVAIAVFFFVVKPMNMLNARRAAKEGPSDPTTKACPYCLSEIPLGASRCPQCTSDLGSQPALEA
ncbi:MAG: large conductance mechanosensitive channel protein MscL [Acidimicrobiales bacterium]